VFHARLNFLLAQNFGSWSAVQRLVGDRIRDAGGRVCPMACGACLGDMLRTRLTRQLKMLDSTLRFRMLVVPFVHRQKGICCEF
jgi:hypothetical protein